MFELSPLMIDALNQKFKWHYGNVSELDEPILVVFDYSPTDNHPSLSIAFSVSEKAKCWLSERQLLKIKDEAPSPHPDYRSFKLQGRMFFPYSITAFSKLYFEEIGCLISACQMLYQHIDWEE